MYTLFIMYHGLGWGNKWWAQFEMLSMFRDTPTLLLFKMGRGCIAHDRRVGHIACILGPLPKIDCVDRHRCSFM